MNNNVEFVGYNLMSLNGSETFKLKYTYLFTWRLSWYSFNDPMLLKILITERCTQSKIKTNNGSVTSIN